MTVRAVLTMTVPQPSSADFEREWRAVATWVQSQAGCLQQTLGRAVGDGDTTYVITSDWTDYDTYRHFETSERQDGVTAGLRGLRTSVRMEVLEIIDHKGES
jgi:heme-degrading monooxygenase HmoA